MDADSMYGWADQLVKQRKENPERFRADPKPASRVLRKDAPKPPDTWRDAVLERDQGCVVHVNPADCDEGFDAHHVVPQQRLRREAPELLWEPEAGVGVCGLAHRQHHSCVRRIRWQELPASVRAFLRAAGFGAYLQRHYPFVEEAA
jgi:hypothetical protein